MDINTAGDPHPDLTVAVCTWNRAALLRRTLESFTALHVPPGTSFEVLVVDNNCTDATPVVLAEFANRLPLRVVQEAEQGIAHARNRVAREARGEYVLCTDDDVEVEPGWLVAYADTFRARPHADVFGGTILPRFEGTPPRWLTACWEMVKGVYAARDLGPQGFDLRPVAGHLPFGANYAARAATLRLFSCDARLGMRAGQRRLGEETTVLAQILLGGGRGRWVPQARVHHWVPRARQTLAFVQEHVELAAQMLLPFDNPPPADSAHRLRRRVRKHMLRYRLKRPFAAPQTWVRHWVSAADARGRLRLVEGEAADPLYAAHVAGRDVPGFIDPRAGAALYTFARACAPTGTVVELGSWQGRSTVYLASAVRDRGAGRVHAVDTWRGGPELARSLAGKDPDWLYRTFLHNIGHRGLAAHVQPWRMSTLEAARRWSGEPIGLLFINADHDYDAVCADFAAWAPYVAPGGYIAFDDVPHWPGPTRFISQLPAFSYEWVSAPPNQWVVRKLAQADAEQGISALA